ncbi:putative P-loop containing nucleoside triphosphate hydrolase [Rosa chinensis]|uniref:Putative P-loop containing nucleoside triphosphate hydrolase n=1 Tax=Rosa chinensis TaxID=74649 RepID=A0A2P6QSJ3_ROSCH|nr:protein SMAX1-LIKE 4 [Rosa chinensis]PRQ37130.1 putative P-loop containing nucleoside triphosphate hydrolase [Rosa chinensis]
MRSGGCAVQQTLTAEAASVLKHSLSLARRRGHAQVTPLHVAATLLASRTSLLRRACLKAAAAANHNPPHHHPLQCRALELCFNVALNRLPTTPPSGGGGAASPLLVNHGQHHQQQQPSLSNALIAALKRAQAHQRRGCIEQQNQQQPLLTIKVELEQLIISILDDPSVSRVMREAGFSSTSVKNNLEDTSSVSSVFQCYNSTGGVFSSPCSPTAPENLTHHHISPSGNFWQTHFLTYTPEQNPLLFSSPPKKLLLPFNVSSISTPTESVSYSKEDVKLVFEVLVRKNSKKRNTVIVGDSVSITEGLVAEVMGRLERRSEVPEELKSTHFIKFQFPHVSLRYMKREDVESNITELKRKLDHSGGGGAIIYIGDLKWTIGDEREGGLVSGGYSPVEHLVSEISRLVSDYESSSCSSTKPKVWLMATASYQTYMRCQMRQPSLEIQWGLQAVSVPSGGLGLSLHASSVHDSRVIFSQNPSEVLETKPFSSIKDHEQDHGKLPCCEECTSNFEKEAQLLKSGQQKLPAWLQPHGTQSCQKDEVVELRRKWNRLCYSLHQGRHNPNHSSPALYNHQNSIGKNHSYSTSSYPWLSTRNGIFPDLNSISFADHPASDPATHGSNLVPRFRRQQSCSTIEFNFDNGVQKHEVVEPTLDSLKLSEDKEVKITLALGNSVFTDSGESTVQRADMCKLLKENVPWQSESIPSIVEAIIGSKPCSETWFLIDGNDSIGKRRLAQAIAELVLGSANSLLHINMNKREDEMHPRVEKLKKALKSSDKLVVLVEDVDLADTQFLKFLADRKCGEVSRRDGNQGQAIFILTKGESTRNEYPGSIIQMKLKVDEKSTSPSFGIASFEHKRKAEWELENKTKSTRFEEKEDSSVVVAFENVNSKKDFSRQSSFNSNLDLNLKAGEDNEIEDNAGEVSPISSDLTRDSATDVQTPLGFLESVENLFVFNRSPARDREATELFLSKIEGCFEGVYGKQNGVSFSVDKRVLEEISVGSGSFPNSLFEKWLKGIFQTSLKSVKFGGKEGILVRLCLGGTEEGILEGFLGSCLPKKIQIS